jgi:hypothetical protein
MGWSSSPSTRPRAVATRTLKETGTGNRQWPNGGFRDDAQCGPRARHARHLLIPPLSGITLTSAVGIDSAGEIVAFGTDASGQTNEYLLNPLESNVPEPSTLAVFTVTIATLLISRAGRCRSAR